MKVFRQSDDKVAFFRPQFHIDRLWRACERLCLPTFDKDALLRLLATLIRIDKKFVLPGDGYALYVRPVIFATQPTLGIQAPHYAKLLVLSCPVGAYFGADSRKPITVLADTAYIRAWPGGVGAFKAGGNYARTVRAQAKAEARGCAQIVWLLPDGSGDYFITESGAMNLFIYWKPTDDSDLELATYPTTDGLVLAGVTRDSIVCLARQQGYVVREVGLRLHADFLPALRAGRVHEVFGTGTAVGVYPVGAFVFEDTTLTVPFPAPPDTSVALKLLKALRDVQHGRTVYQERTGDMQETGMPGPWTLTDEVILDPAHGTSFFRF